MPRLLILLALAACGVELPEPAPLSTTPLDFYFDDELGWRLYSDGAFAMRYTSSTMGAPPVTSWQTTMALSADGSVHGPAGGFAGRLEPDGTFATADGSPATFRFDDDVLVAREGRFAIEPDGTVTGGNPAIVMRVDGATDAATRRTALLAFQLVFGDADDGWVESDGALDADARPASPPPF